MGKNSLGEIMRWFKGRCTFEIRKGNFNPNFSWQPRYYDHVIRNDQEYNDIQAYILTNVVNWKKDEENLHK